MDKDNQHRPARKLRPEPESISWSDYPRIAPGEYSAYCRCVVQYRDPGFKRWVCLLLWDLLSDNHVEVIARVPMFLPLGAANKPRASRRGRYFPEWVRANGAPPVRRDRLSPRVFQRRVARVVIGDTGGPAPYSVVRQIIEWQTGREGNN